MMLPKRKKIWIWHPCIRHKQIRRRMFLTKEILMMQEVSRARYTIPSFNFAIFDTVDLSICRSEAYGMLSCFYRSTPPAPAHMFCVGCFKTMWSANRKLAVSVREIHILGDQQ